MEELGYASMLELKRRLGSRLDDLQLFIYFWLLKKEMDWSMLGVIG